MGAYLEDMRHSIFPVNFFLHHTILVDAYSGKEIQHRLVHGIETVNNQGHGDALPSWDALFR